MSALFSLNELGKGRVSQQESRHDAALQLKYLSLHTRKIAGLRDLTEGLPQEGELHFLFTQKSFNAFTFIPFLLQHYRHIDELHLSTFNINLRVLESLMQVFHRGELGRLQILVSDSIQKRYPKVYDQLQAFSQQAGDRVKISYVWNHSKITLARCGEAAYVVEGSGNWSENAAYEQYLFARSEALYQFRKSCLESAN